MEQKNGAATASTILGIVSLVLAIIGGITFGVIGAAIALILGIVAVVLGINAKKQDVQSVVLLSPAVPKQVILVMDALVVPV